MCPEHIKTHIHLNLTRLPDYDGVRSEIETFLEARQSSSNPDANCGQRGLWAAECPKRGKNGQGGKGENGKGHGKKMQIRLMEKHMMARRKAKAKGDKWQARKTFEGYRNHCWKWGYMEKECFTKAKTKGKGKSAGSLDESEASVPENTSVGGFGLCSFGNSQYDEWKWNGCRKATFTLDSGAAVSVAPPDGNRRTEIVQNDDWRIRNKMKDFECYRL